MSSKAKSAAFDVASPSGRSIRLRSAMTVQAIEENPLDAEQTLMFEMFEREHWSHEKRRAHLIARLPKKSD